MSIYPSTKVAPYIYWLTHKITGQFYIGYRESNLVPSDQDLGFIYFTSSNKIKSLKFENFEYQILAEFFDGDSAYDFENQLIKQHIKDPLCLNQSYTKEGSRKFSMAGKNHSIESRERMSKNKLGTIVGPYGPRSIPKTIEERIAISARTTGSNNPRARIIKVKAPNGEVFEANGNFRTFCKERNLPFTTLRNLLGNPKRIIRKGKAVGWTCQHDHTL